MTFRALIVNADDFGLTAGVNRGIAHAHDHGIVTSASLMVRMEAVAEAAALGRDRPALALGLHVDLGEWRFADGEWHEHRRIVDLEDAHAIEQEVHDQVRTFVSLTGREPTHLDSHQHVHRGGPARDVIERAARRLGVPLRGHDDVVQHCGSFYGQTGEGSPLPAGISIDALIDLVRGLPSGVTELGCHPGYADGLDDVYRSERELEIETLCHPAVRQALADEGIELRSFHELTS